MSLGQQTKAPTDMTKRLRLTRPVVLVGMMGVGKTSVGTALSRILSVPFVDSDDEIIKAAQMQIAEIFARDGEAFFRAREREILARLLTDAPAIISTGGGAFLSEDNRAAIAANGVSIWLQAELDLLWQRVRAKTNRPLLRTDNPKETLENLLTARIPFYALADMSVTSEPGQSIDTMAHKVIAELSSRGLIQEA